MFQHNFSLCITLLSTLNMSDAQVTSIDSLINSVGIWSDSLDIEGASDGDNLGSLSGLALSSDGSIIAVGARESNLDTGYVQIYDASTAVPIQLGSDIYGNQATDAFGGSIDLSADGYTIVIGADKGIDLSGVTNGYVKIYSYSPALNSWSQMGNTLYGSSGNDRFGSNVRISPGGDRIVVCAQRIEQAYIYEYSTSSDAWVVSETISGTSSGDKFGISLDLSSDGNVLAIGASAAEYIDVYRYDDLNGIWQLYGSRLLCSGCGVRNGLSLNNDGSLIAISVSASAEVRVMEFDTSTFDWILRGNSLQNTGTNFGRSISLSDDGNVLIASDYQYDSNRGRVYSFKYDSSTSDWVKFGDDVFGYSMNDYFGGMTCLSGDGSILASSGPGISISANTVSASKGYIKVMSYDPLSPSWAPSKFESVKPSTVPTEDLTNAPTNPPSLLTSVSPTMKPSFIRTLLPSNQPSQYPSAKTSSVPSSSPSIPKSNQPSQDPSAKSSSVLSSSPSIPKSNQQSQDPSIGKTSLPSDHPSSSPSVAISEHPSHHPSIDKSASPSIILSFMKSIVSSNPSQPPTKSSSANPTIDFSKVDISSVLPTSTQQPSYNINVQQSNFPTSTKSLLSTSFSSIDSSPKPSPYISSHLPTKSLFPSNLLSTQLKSPQPTLALNSSFTIDVLSTLTPSKHISSIPSNTNLSPVPSQPSFLALRSNFPSPVPSFTPSISPTQTSESHYLSLIPTLHLTANSEDISPNPSFQPSASIVLRRPYSTDIPSNSDSLQNPFPSSSSTTMKTRSPSLKGIASVTIEPSIFPSDNSSSARATSIGLVGALCAAASAASASSAVSTVPLQQYDERTVVDCSHKAYLQEKESTSKILTLSNSLPKNRMATAWRSIDKELENDENVQNNESDEENQLIHQHYHHVDPSSYTDVSMDETSPCLQEQLAEVEAGIEDTENNHKSKRKINVTNTAPLVKTDEEPIYNQRAFHIRNQNFKVYVLTVIVSLKLTN